MNVLAGLSMFPRLKQIAVQRVQAAFAPLIAYVGQALA